jgi:hypothetical protein
MYLVIILPEDVSYKQLHLDKYIPLLASHLLSMSVLVLID